MKKSLLAVAMAITVTSQLTGCAGSAAHKVVSANQSGDSELTCETVESELVKAQAIIDDVNKDKDDISGADVIDGVLWFPFNLVAKHSNYNNAIEAADRRIAKLNEIKEEKSCNGMSDEQLAEKTRSLSDELNKLAMMHKDGQLSDQEYLNAKQKILDGY